VPSILRSPECMPHPGHWVSQVAKELDEALAVLDEGDKQPPRQAR